MNLKVTVTPKITGPQTFEIETRLEPEGTPFAHTVALKVVDLKEQVIRAALIALGWTPPAK